MSCALVIGGTKNDWEAMAVFLLNFKSVMPDLVDDIIVFHDGITKKHQNKMNKIAEIKFVKYKCPVPKWKCLSNKSIRYFSRMVFCKYECFRLLDEYDSVIWSDYDVVIKESIHELLDMNSKFAVICNEDTPLQGNFYMHKKNKEIYNYDLGRETICTPLLIMSKNIGDFAEYYKWCYEQTQKFLSDLYLPEQAIISMLVQKFKISYEKIDRRIYCSHPSEDADDIKILHAYGQPKFWNGLENEIWNYYNHVWRELK